jgi:hypothetical protein
MIPGFWWPGEQNDPAHFEWHPQLDGQSNTLPNPGHALPDNSLHPGYKWKLPDTLYVWRKSKSNEDTKSFRQMLGPGNFRRPPFVF